MYINENNLDIYINEFIKILKKYKENNTNDTFILNEINVNLFNKSLDCNIISEILKNDENKENFSKEIKDKIFTSIIKKYVEEFQLEKQFDELIKSLEKQGEGVYNIITDEDQLSLLIEILSNPSSISILIVKNPIIFAKLNYNFTKINKGNFDLNKSKDIILNIQQNITSKTNWITNMINDIFMDKNSGNLDTKKIDEYYKKIKETLDKKFTKKEKDLFTVFITNKKDFDTIFSLILSNLNKKMQNECNNINSENIIIFENLLKNEVSIFNNNRTTFILKFILNKLKSKIKKSSTSSIENITNKNLSEVKKNITEQTKNCLNEPEKCKDVISETINKGKELLNVFKNLKK